jgi:DDE superfamily endonuclease
MFTTNAKGWTNNFYGMQWIQHFNARMRLHLQDPDEYRLLLCDGHNSHISAAFVGYYIQNRIELVLLPPHSSHLLQLLDVRVFAPLKMALAHKQTHLFRSGVRRIEKPEWLEHYIEAREEGITEKNILAGWRGAGLFLENMYRVLHQLSDIAAPISTLASPSANATSTPFFLSSSPPDPAILRSTNQAFLATSTIADLDMDYKRQMRRLSGISERLQTEVTMLQKELKEVKEVNAKRKERASGKRIILKDKSILSTEEVHQALKEAEEITYAKKLKKKKGMIKKGRKEKVLSSEIHDGASYGGDEDDNLSVAESLHLEDIEILECIEVVF